MTHRGYRIEALGTFALFKVMSPGSGPVPTELVGTYTSTTEAKQAIDRSLAKLTGRKSRAQKESTA